MTNHGAYEVHYIDKVKENELLLKDVNYDKS